MLVRNFNRLCNLQGIFNVRSVANARAVSYLCIECKTPQKSGLNVPRQNCFKGAHQISRLFSTASSDDQIVLYDEIKDLPNHPEKLLIDVREPDELVTFGKIPTSINIPLKTVQETLTSKLAKENFKKDFGRTFPERSDEIIFMCQKGIRSQKALVIASGLGFKNVKNYKGSWIDWAEHEGIPLPS